MNLKETISVGISLWNKEDLVPKLVRGLKVSFDTRRDWFFFLFDNCTDDTIKKTLTLTRGLNCIYEATDRDLFEVKANNRIIQSFMMNRPGNTLVLFQDDIVCNDRDIRDKIFRVQSNIENLGLMGGRSGFELESTEFPEKPVLKVSNWEHKKSQYGQRLKEGEYRVRTFLNRGPLVFNRFLIEKAGFLDEEYYPQWGDELDYCARVTYEHNLRNVVFECDVESKLEWGGMRKKNTPLSKFKGFQEENWERFTRKWGRYFEDTT